MKTKCVQIYVRIFFNICPNFLLEMANLRLPAYMYTLDTLQAQMISKSDSGNFFIGKQPKSLLATIWICILFKLLLSDADTDQGHQGHSFVEECQRDLRHQYLQSLCKIALFPGDTENFIDMNEIYTNLSILIDLPSPMMPIQIPLVSHHEIFTRKTDNGDLPNRILILGDAGCGKSTLIAKIAHDWATHADGSPVKDVPLLFALNMRWMSTGQTLEEAILQQLMPRDTPITPRRVKQYIQENQDSVYILLDSYDEFAGGEQIGRSTRDSIMQILANQHLKHCRVVVTSRVWKAAHFSTVRREYTKMEVKGFSNDNVNHYVKTFFKNDEDLGKGLLEYLEDNSLHSGIASVPMVTLLICLYWRETQGDKSKIPAKIGELYTGIFSLMYKHYLTKDDARKIDFDQVTTTLGRVALEGLWPPHNKIVFPMADVVQTTSEDIVVSACEIGLLSMEQISIATQVSSLFKRDFVSRVNKQTKFKDKSLTFFHKTGQERCAAEYLAELEASDAKQCAQLLKKLDSVNSCFGVEMVLRFACGVNISIAAMVLQRLLEIYRTELASDAGDYYRDNLPVDKTKNMQLFTELCLQCNYESESTGDFNALLNELFPSGTMFFLGMSPYTNLAIQKYLNDVNAPTDIKTLSVSEIPRPGDDPWIYGSRKAMQEILSAAQAEFKRKPEEELRHVFQEYTQRSDREMGNFVDAIGVDVHRGVCYIELWDYFKQWQTTQYMNLNPIFASLHQVKLNTLDLSRVRLGAQIEKVIDIIELGNLSYLRCLKLVDVGLTAHYAKQLLETAKKALPSLTVLNLSKNNIGEALEESAECLPDTLKELDVTLNGTSAQAMTALAQRLPTLDELQVYRTYGNDMDDESGTKLAASLQRMTKMTNIAISVFGLNLRVHRKLVTALGQLKSLHILSVADSPYPDDLLEYLAEILPHLQEVNDIYLRAKKVKKSCQAKSSSPGDEDGSGIANKSQMISKEAGEPFVAAIKKMTKLRELSMFDIRLADEDFVELLEHCRSAEYGLLG